MTCRGDGRGAGLARQASLVVAALLAPPAHAASTDDARPEATPYRPTVSTPAQLSAPHWLEGEFGGLQTRNGRYDDGLDRRSSVPCSFKYAFSEDWGVRIDGEAVVHTRDAQGNRETSFGDTDVVAKRRFAVDAVSAFGLEAGVSAPTARKGLGSGSGKPDYFANGIYSGDFDEWHTDVNFVGTRLGARDSGARYRQQGAVALSHPLLDRWTAAVEVSGTREHGAASTSQLLVAFSYAIRPDIVVDIGTAHGLNRASTTWQAFSGVTVVIGRID